MNILSEKPFIVIDLGSGRYVQTKVGHEYYNLLENPIDGRFYGYCPPWDNININNLGAGRDDDLIDDVVVIYTTKVKDSNNRVIVAFTDCATVHRHGIIDENLQRIVNYDGEIKHCSYTVESNYLYNLESYPLKFIIKIADYNSYMFRKQRFFKGTYKSLDEKIIAYLEKYLENSEFYEDELYQEEIRNKDISGLSKFSNTFEKKPQWSETGGSMAVKKNAAYGKQAIVDADYLCEADAKHQTFMTNKGVPYMEGHHLIPCTAQNAKEYWYKYKRSIDCVENIMCLCPTCHRKIHFGSIEEKKAIIKQLYLKQNSKLREAGLNITLGDLTNLYLKN